jgi:hypothetical protein
MGPIRFHGVPIIARQWTPKDQLLTVNLEAWERYRRTLIVKPEPIEVWFNEGVLRNRESAQRIMDDSFHREGGRL